MENSIQLGALVKWVGRTRNLRGGEFIEFSAFIDLMELVDLPTVGENFTWSSVNGWSRSRIDRFMLFEELVDCWKVGCQEIRPKDISDHSLVWLKCKMKNWGRKPFGP